MLTLTQVCRRCKERPPRLPPTREKGDGASFYCEPCFLLAKEERRLKAIKTASRWQKKHRKRHRAAMARWRAAHPEVQAARERKYQYGLTDAQFRRMVKKQSGCCAICGKKCPVDEGPPQKRLCVDPDHASGRPRGLLCRSCNVAVGLLRDDPNLAEAVAAYLRRHAV